MFVYCMTSVTHTAKMTVLVLVFPASSLLITWLGLESVKNAGLYPFIFLLWLIPLAIKLCCILNINKTLVINKNHFYLLDLFSLCLF